MNKQKQSRRRSALNRLKVQLQKGSKNTKEGVIVLTDHDKTRIEKEIAKLESIV